MLQHFISKMLQHLFLQHFSFFFNILQHFLDQHFFEPSSSPVAAPCLPAATPR
jgi:hypothetical protein